LNDGGVTIRLRRKTTDDRRSAPRCVVIGDLNGDGDLDLAVTMLLPKTFPSFLTWERDLRLRLKPWCRALSHFPSRWRLERRRHLTCRGKSVCQIRASILLNEGAGIFAPAVSYRLGNSPDPVRDRRLNGDGHLDLAVANGDSDNVILLKTVWKV